MQHTVKLMTIVISESSSGMFFATSEDEPGFFVSEFSVQALYDLIPVVISQMFEGRTGIKMSVFPTDRGDIGHKHWAVIPIELMAQASADQAARDRI